ncbi:MAG: RNA polymerase sigma factor [Cyclobacteriaceae bacterium]|nr:RNA polymerase sigma factor [Cyclobacteriaceae bacterium]MCH8515619.1 RNA polymerase sigma factor [Cyclobacteriaceae bacterium]
MSNLDLNDSRLVKLYQNGDDEAFRVLVERHKDRIFTTIYLIVKEKYVAEDLLQDTFIKAVKTIKEGRYNEEGKFLPWILRIAHNLAIDHFRKGKRYPTIVMDDGVNLMDKLNFVDPSMEDDHIKKEIKVKLKQYIKDLPKAQKQVLIMRHFLDMSFQEIADATNVSINTALGRMRYALINLRKKMEKNSEVYDNKFYP